MSELERWEGRYAIPNYLFGDAPNYFLEQCDKYLPKSGKVLAVADGEGRNGVWLARKGLNVVSLDFAPTAQSKAKKLAEQNNVKIDIVEADVHSWAYPENTFDVVVEIFTQFSSPEQRHAKWTGMINALKPGGLLIIQGYSPDQLKFGTGGPKNIENLYTKSLYEDYFGEFDNLNIEEQELELSEGEAHGGISAVINLVGYKPHK